ncbi:unnamed protein product, partial [Arabidopsis halleri]
FRRFIQATQASNKVVPSKLGSTLDPLHILKGYPNHRVTIPFTIYGHMIDNVVLIVTGTLHERDVQELLEKCHPLGMFDSIDTLAVAQNMRELYRLVLVDTPLAPYFSECLTSEVQQSCRITLALSSQEKTGRNCTLTLVSFAEGRVCSTDPAETVHNRPLGQNACKVWVDASMIDNAKVWRPNSEVQFIADAQGTTVAWPNDKIVYL